jgi:hypothetical protein
VGLISGCASSSRDAAGLVERRSTIEGPSGHRTPPRTLPSSPPTCGTGPVSILGIECPPKRHCRWRRSAGQRGGGLADFIDGAVVAEGAKCRCRSGSRSLACVARPPSPLPSGNTPQPL